MTEAQALDALRDIAGPEGGDIVSAGLVEALSLHGDILEAALRTTRANAHRMENIRRDAEARLRALPGIRDARVVLTAHRDPPPPPKPAGDRYLTDIPTVIAVASGKGGVGKSTVAVNLAVALAAEGFATGLIDADIYGPSLPSMLGRHEKPQMAGNRFVPVEAFGIRAMSIGFLVEGRQALIWRGPMVIGALQQLMGQTEWGRLDVMIVDLPPGTGDAQLTLAQRASLAGAVIVSTPQDIALIDARRAVAMFDQVGVSILGIVENMSFFACPHCGERTDLFGHGGARAEAARLSVPFLGEIPLAMAVRESGDRGTPIVNAAPESAAARALAGIAAGLAEKFRPHIERARSRT